MVDKDMATHGEARINTPPPPKNTMPGLLGRLLQRTRSKKEREQAVDRETFVTSTNLRVPEPTFHPSATEALTAPQPAMRAAPEPRQSTMGLPVIHHQRPAPALKKRPSIRDKFKALSKDAPTPIPVEEPGKKRTVYVPTHAAADMSRLAISPRPVSRQQQRFSFSYDEPRDSPSQEASEQAATVTVHSSADEHHGPLVARHYSQRGLATLDENEPVQAHSRMSKRISEPGTLVPRASLGEVYQQHHDVAGARDFGPSPSCNMPSLPSQSPESPEHAPRARTRDGERQPLSDYELFLARAEERERAYREHLLRSLSQRQYPGPEPEAVHSQPRNSATYTADSAVVAEASNQLRKGWEGRVNEGLDSGIGSKSSSQQTKPRSADESAAVGMRVGSNNAWERGHRKRGSWTPSFGAGGGRDAERRLERDDAGAIAEEEAGYQRGAYTTSRGDIAGPYGAGGEYTTQQPRTLKRQTSIKQKLGAYIKPARPPTHYDEPGLTRGRSVRRS